jgi:parvulin-like peptidyl-prolyl isomerase
MKKLIIFLFASAFIMTACVKQGSVDENAKKTDTVKSKTDEKSVKNTKAVSKDKKESKKEEIKDEPLVLPDVLAEIKGEKIKKDEVQKEIEKMEKIYKQFGQRLNLKQKQKIAGDILNKLIDKKVITVYAQENKITPDPETVKKQLETFKKSFKKDEDLKKFLEKHNLTEEKLTQTLTERALRETVITKEVIDKIKIDDKDVKKYYDEHQKEFNEEAQVKARHILFKTPKLLPKDATPEQKADFEAKDKAAKDKAEALLAQIKKNPKTDFEKLAKEKSEGPSAKNGGDLGWFTERRMVKPFAEVAFKLKKGEISEVVKTSFGYHIIKVEDKKDAKLLTFEEVKKRIEDKLKRGKIREDSQSFQRMLRTKYQVKTFLK